MSQAATRKVTFKFDEIFVDGVRVGHFAGRPEVYVHLITGEFSSPPVARFKRYLNKATAKTLAKRWTKFVLSRLTPAEVVEKLKDYKTTPMQLAWDLGMPKPSVTTPVSTLNLSPRVANILFV